MMMILVPHEIRRRSIDPWMMTTTTTPVHRGGRERGILQKRTTIRRNGGHQQPLHCGITMSHSRMPWVWGHCESRRCHRVRSEGIIATILIIIIRVVVVPGRPETNSFPRRRWVGTAIIDRMPWIRRRRRHRHHHPPTDSVPQQSRMLYTPARPLPVSTKRNRPLPHRRRRYV